MRIGKNLIRYRFSKGWSQEDLAREVGMSQSNYSKIESDKQDASPENSLKSLQVRLVLRRQAFWAQTARFSPVKTSNGGHANNYFVQNGAEALIAAKDETIAVLKERLRTLDEDNRNLREQLYQLIGKVIDK